MLRVAIVYEDEHIYLSWTPEKFREILRGYLEKYSLDESFKKIEQDIKSETRKS